MFTTTDIPDTFTPEPKRVNESAKRRNGVRNRDGEYRTRRQRSNDAYMTREFVAWDGEGINEPDGSHTYVMIANSDGAELHAREGLKTTEVFELFLDSRKDVTNIIYGGGYDINMILKDLNRDSLTRLYTTGKVRWNGYSIEWRGGKSFSVRTANRSFLLYDVLPFFQRSFVSACDEYLGEDWPYREAIIAGKANRGSFDYESIGDVDEYNRAELATLVRLANELRTRLFKVEIRVSRWDGPGAIASALFKQYSTKSYLDSAPPSVAEAGRYAYAGGRFEIVRKGHSDFPAYQYDLRSAYPSAARNLPCLAHGQWRHVARPIDIARFGVYRVEVTSRYGHSSQPQPFWHRNPDGTVFFSSYPHGWFWSPEARLAHPDHATIHEGWEWIQECDHKPFSFVEPLYNKRAALKKAGDGAHVGLKLGLNSLYGKLAQQIGWDPGPPLKLPPYHSLEWAGWITSHCRSEVYRAAMLAPDDIIAFETDAVFSRVPLDVPIGERLGEWDYTEYTSLTYLKSGFYWGTQITKDGPKEIEKSRGINKGSIARGDAISALVRHDVDYLPATQTRFVTLGQALHQNFDLWTHWVTAPRNISVALTGKRIDSLVKPHADREDGWTETQEGFHNTSFSYPYEVEWITGSTIRDPEGRRLAELRINDSDDNFGIDYD